MKQKTLLLIIIGVAVLAVIVATIRFATRKGTEKIAENIVENALNGQVDIDYNNNSVAVNTNSGQLMAGDNVSLPSDFPNDVYVIDGDIKAVITSAENEGHHLTIETPSTPAAAYATYDREIKAAGWTVTTTGTYGGTYTVMAKKDNRLLSVSMSDSDGKTMVIITEYSDTSDDTNTLPE